MVSMITELAEFIVDREDNDTQLHDAAFTGNIEALRLLLQDEQMKAHINSRIRPFGASPLRLAATAGHRDCIVYLLKSGSYVDLIDFKAQTPLFVAVKNNHTECVKELLEAGACPDGDERNRCTPLHMACQNGYIQEVKLLLLYGANTEIPFRLLGGGIPGLPLHVSLLYQHYECFITLLLDGAETDLRFNDPPIPELIIARISLFHCVVYHRLPVKYAELLINFGACLWQKDEKGRLAIDLPQECPSKEYIKEQMYHPLSLQFLCRIKIRRILGRPYVFKLNLLPLPVRLHQFLSFCDCIQSMDFSVNKV